MLGSVGVVMSINEQEGIATVKFPSCEYRRACKASDVLTVPISRLCTPRSEVRPVQSRDAMVRNQVALLITLIRMEITMVSHGHLDCFLFQQF